tara:strand:- start:5754 stop:7406 length:1653 start_codon:yes stop_codon:yes gene_type:complete
LQIKNILVIVVAFSGNAFAEMEREVWEWAEGPTLDILHNSVEWVAGEGVMLARLSPEKNVAAGMVAKDDLGLRVPLTDGDVSLGVSEWVSNNPNVFGRNFIVDLGQDRAITRVRVLPGQTAINQPEYFVRGYRLEAAGTNDSDLWRILAEARDNINLTIDTSTDSTWSVRDRDQNDVFRRGRFVRLTITRQDRSNWVALGEIEVFAVGYEIEGLLTGQLSTSGPVNVGRVHWEVSVPEGTAFQLASAPGADVIPWQAIHTMENGELFAGQEPVEVVAWRGQMFTSEPFATPTWQRVEIEYDRRLVASSVVGSVLPVTVRRGEETEVTYRLEIEVSSEDYGVDLVRLSGVAMSVQEVLINGRSLNAGQDYTTSLDIVAQETRLALDGNNRVEDDAVIEVIGNVRLLADSNVIRPMLGNAGQSVDDGYTNWQNGHNPLAISQISAQGEPGDLVGQLQLSQRVFSPYLDEQVSFDFVVSRLSNPTDVLLSVYNLNGNRVRQHVQYGAARNYQMAWDGRDENARIVEPGIYLFEIEVRGGGVEGMRRGTCVVAY